MSERYLTGEVEKCWACGGTGFTISEGHPDCPACSGNGYISTEIKRCPKCKRKTHINYTMGSKPHIVCENYGFGCDYVEGVGYIKI